MYLPTRFKNENMEQSIELIHKNPFATLISVHDGKPFVSHVPLILEKNNDDTLILYGHLARANPHSNLLENGDVYVIFQGPQSYITPTWYVRNDVPTWNYATVHITGNCSLITDRAGITTCLKKLTEHVEGHKPERWSFWIPEDLARDGALENAIVGFKITVELLQAKFKLSHRSEADRLGVMRGLEQRTDDMSKGVLSLMRQWAEA